MTRIYSGDNYNSIYNASNNATDENVAGLGQNQLSEVNGNCLAFPKEYKRDGRDQDGDCRDHRTHHHHHHHQQNPIGDPQVAAEIKQLLQELEQLLQGALGGSPFGGGNQFGGGQMYPMNRQPIDADKISFRMNEK